MSAYSAILMGGLSQFLKKKKTLAISCYHCWELLGPLWGHRLFFEWVDAVG